MVVCAVEVGSKAKKSYKLTFQRGKLFIVVLTQFLKRRKCITVCIYDLPNSTGKTGCDAREESVHRKGFYFLGQTFLNF